MKHRTVWHRVRLAWAVGEGPSKARPSAQGWGAMWALVAACVAGGCGSPEGNRITQWDRRPGSLWVVAPVLNLSGSRDIDVLAATDIAVSELSQLRGGGVLPTNRVLSVLASMGLQEVRTPEEAAELASRSGAEAVVVLAITEYDPYDPPTVGLIGQVYRPVHGGGEVEDPVTVSRRGLGDESPVLASWPGRPEAQLQRVYRASDGAVMERLRRYAEVRAAGGSPYGWREYLVRQDLYLRFCAHALLSELTGLRAWRAADGR